MGTFRSNGLCLQLAANFLRRSELPAFSVALVAVRILVTGITGAIGSRLAPRLVSDGHQVRGLSRRPNLLATAGIEVVQADVVTGAGLEQAMREIDVAYFLIHSMESGADRPFAALEQQAAANFAAAAQQAGVRRTIYLGGLIPNEVNPSPHLASRLAVEERLLNATPEAVAFRASIVIGATSRSFRFLVRLIERMPILIVPGWHGNRTAPIDERDVTSFLAAAAATQVLSDRESLDIGGPEVLSYGALIERIRDQMLVSRPVLRVPQLTLTPIASRVSSVIASEEYALIGPLMEGLDTDLLARDDRAAAMLGIRRHSLDAAIERALREWERVEPLRAR